MTKEASWARNPESLDTSVTSPRVITTGRQIADALKIVNERAREVYKLGLENPDFGVIDEGVFSISPAPQIPPFERINRNKYRTAIKGPVSDVATFKVISDHTVEQERDFGQVELELTDAIITSVNLIDKEPSSLFNSGRKNVDIILGARQYYKSLGGTIVIVCGFGLDEVEMNIYERTGVWSDVTMDGIEIGLA